MPEEGIGHAAAAPQRRTVRRPELVGGIPDAGGFRRRLRCAHELIPRFSRRPDMGFPPTSARMLARVAEPSGVAADYWLSKRTK
jgi:hypothetical protein